MAQKKFLFSTADCYFYKTGTNDLIFKSQTLIDSSIEATIQNEDARAGKGNVLQFIYFHSSEFNVKMTEQQFDLTKLAPSIGASIITGSIIQVEETVTLTAGGAGTVTTGTPVNDKYVTDANVKGTVMNGDVATTVTFTGSAFTLAGGTTGDKVCVIYNILDPAARYIEVNSNMIPSVGRLVMKAQLGSSESGNADGSSVIGEVIIEVPTLQLNPTGASLQMTASGVSQSEISGRALAFSSSTAGCTSKSVYATITERIYGATVYDTAYALIATDSDITLSAGANTQKIDLLLLPTYVGVPFAPNYADITFTSGTPVTATVNSSTGVVTRVAAGTSTITCTVTSKPALTCKVVVTCS
jgi:hypothetical protein